MIVEIGHIPGNYSTRIFFDQEKMIYDDVDIDSLGY